MATFQHLLIRRDGAVEYLELNRPQVRNAFNEELIAELISWAEAAVRDRDLRVVVLSGAGPSFCAGADLAWMQKMADYSYDENVRDATAAANMLAAFDQLPVPVIARVHGPAIGGGAGLVAVADIAIAQEDAVFAFSEVKFGLLPATIAPYVIAKIGVSAARELFLSGRKFDAQRALQLGLVHAVVPASKLDETVEYYIKEVRTAGRDAVAAAKALIRRIAYRPIDEVRQLTVTAIAEQRVSPEAQQRMKKFLKKD